MPSSDLMSAAFTYCDEYEVVDVSIVSNVDEQSQETSRGCNHEAPVQLLHPAHARTVVVTIECENVQIFSCDPDVM